MRFNAGIYERALSVIRDTLDKRMTWGVGSLPETDADLLEISMAIVNAMDEDRELWPDGHGEPDPRRDDWDGPGLDELTEYDTDVRTRADRLQDLENGYDWIEKRISEEQEIRRQVVGRVDRGLRAVEQGLESLSRKIRDIEDGLPKLSERVEELEWWRKEWE